MFLKSLTVTKKFKLIKEINQRCRVLPLICRVIDTVVYKLSVVCCTKDIWINETVSDKLNLFENSCERP